MSVKALKEALAYCLTLMEEPPAGISPQEAEIHRAAMAELAAIEQAADTLVFEASQYTVFNMNLHRALATMRAIQEGTK